MYGCVCYIESGTGGYGDNSAGQMFLIQGPVPGLWQQKRRPHVSSVLCPHTSNAADQHMYGLVVYIESRIILFILI